MLRDNIIRKRIRADKVVTKPPSKSRELKKLQLSNGASGSEKNKERPRWDVNFIGDSHICPSCFRKFDRKAVYTSHVQTCLDAKYRLEEKIKKLNSKVKTSTATLESGNSSVSEQPAAGSTADNKRKRKRTTKKKTEPAEVSVDERPTQLLGSSAKEDSVDWNLDDEEEKKKIDKIKKEIAKKEIFDEDDEDYTPFTGKGTRKKSTSRGTGTGKQQPSTSKGTGTGKQKKLSTSKSTETEEQQQQQPSNDIATETAEQQEPSVSELFAAAEQLQQQPSISVVTIKTEPPETTGNVERHKEDDDDEKGLVIDLKGSEETFKCPTCDKAFETDEKRKYHLTYYHSRQKRFKCKKCDYQGYRKKDTMNHINCVHDLNITLEMLPEYIETVLKAVDEESVAKQAELKRNQLKIKRKLARENKRVKSPNRTEAGGEASSTSEHAEKIVQDETALKPPEKKAPKRKRKEEEVKIKDEELAESPPAKMQRPATPEDTVEMQVARAVFEPIDDIPEYVEYTSRRRQTPLYGESSGVARPIRNRVKPVREDFLYDLSDLLKKEADAHREQVIQSSNGTVKRELRKRAMSTHTREMPNLNVFDAQSKKLDENSFVQPLAPLSSTPDESPSKSKEPRNRRMSVFVTSPRQMYPAQPRSPPYKPRDAGTHKNAGAAHRMASTACENNKASMYDPKFLWTANVEKEFKTPSKTPFASPASVTPVAAVIAPSTSGISAASSILQKLSRSGEKIKSPAMANTNSLLKPKIAEVKQARSTTTDLCKKFELINVTTTTINENEFDIPTAAAINLNPGGNNLLSLGLNEPSGGTVVLEECSDSNSYENDDDEQEDDDDSNDAKPKSGQKKSTKNTIDKRRLSSNRLTVMQRVQENKIRKSRDQLLQRLIKDEHEEEDSSNSSKDLNLFNEA
jgi:uncharacterized C2H2 Zn-finger protein